MLTLTIKTVEELVEKISVQKTIAIQKLIDFIINNNLGDNNTYLGKPLMFSSDKNLGGGICIPDISIFDIESEKPICIIEVCKKEDQYYCTKALKELIQKLPSIQEAFIYEYETETWLSLTAPDNSFCEILSEDLDDAFN